MHASAQGQHVLSARDHACVVARLYPVVAVVAMQHTGNSNTQCNAAYR